MVYRGIAHCGKGLDMGRVLAWRPRNRLSKVSLAPPPLAWALVKAQSEIACCVEHADGVWIIVWTVNREWFFRSVFRDCRGATAAAIEKYEELMAGGWTAMASR
jgi:hypothetical protein